MAHGFNSFVSRSFQGIMARRMNGRQSAISMRTGIFHLYPENGLFLRFTPKDRESRIIWRIRQTIRGHQQRKKGVAWMKATGIVRRIDYRVIIGTKVRSLENTGFSLIFVQFHQYPKP